jgi:type II secretory pathway component PulF
MARFRYKARQESGPDTQGEVEAPSRVLAINQLRQQGMWITELQEVGTAGVASSVHQAGWAKNPWHAFRPISSVAYTGFFRQLGQLVGSGVNMHDAVLSLQSRVGNRRLQRVLREIAPIISAGGTLSAGLERYPQFFPAHIVGMIRGGEAAGKLDEVCSEIARGYELETLTWAGMIIPKLLYVGMVIVALFSVTMPEMLQHGGDPAQSVGQYGYLHQCLAWYFHNTVPKIVRGILIVFIVYEVLRTVLNLGPVRTFRDTVMYFIPAANIFIRNAACSRFVWALKILIGAGIEFPRALDTAATATGNVVMARQIQRAAERVRLGIPATDALVGCSALPVDMRSQLITAEQTGRFDETLTGLSDIANRRRKQWMFWLRMGSFGFMAVTIVVIVAVATIMGWKHYYEIIIDKFGNMDGT